ncbi:MAG TPA: extracellular solute-binding protein [Candidatus Paceibacterota bacterium]|nr:extracellular solute-binding protein [Candidatus Paceibacterota bacterium]
MSNFQTILVGIFIAFFVFAVLIFSGLIKIGGSSNSASAPVGKVVVWGTFSNPELLKVFSDTSGANKDLIINYVKKDESSYEQSLIEAFASGTGPDLFLITPAMIQKFENFAYKIPYASYPQKTFTDSFINGADVYLASDGVIGLPIVVDPMVMYYNKDLLSNEGISEPPSYWDELFNLNSALTKKQNNGTILQSMIALGRYDNINNAKEILSTLLLQSGNAIVERTATGYAPILNGSSSSSSISPFATILNFFTEFSNPTDSAYSWNSALPNSIDMFTGGKLALYLGYASELFKIQSTNPNLSFDVAQMLQTRNSPNKRTYGNIYAIAVNKRSANITAAFGLAGILSSGDTASNFAAAVSLPPASKALLANRPTDPYLFTFFNSAIISRTWLDPDSVKSDAIFSELIQNILSSKLSVDDAINKAQNELELITKK